jgi:hypothetical protein
VLVFGDFSVCLCVIVFTDGWIVLVLLVLVKEVEWGCDSLFVFVFVCFSSVGGVGVCLFVYVCWLQW